MHSAIQQMLKRYECRSWHEHEQALREIFQEIALVGLWRGKFFEHAAFYGGTALRVFYGLDRFSEDLGGFCKTRDRALLVVAKVIASISPHP